MFVFGNYTLPPFSSSATMTVTPNLLGLTNKWLVTSSFTTPILSAFFTTIQALVFTTLIFITKRLRSNKQKLPSKKNPLPPGPLPWPVIGSIPEMLRNRPTFRWIHRIMNELDTNITCIRLGNTHVIPVSCPRIAREILKNQDSIFASRPFSFAAHTISGGYVTTVLSPFGDQWKKMRRVLTSEITCPARHKWLHDKRAEEADNLVTYIYNQYKNNKNVDLRIATRYYCGNVIRRLMFDKRYFGEPMADAGPSVHEIDYVEAIFTALDHLYANCISDYFPWLIGLDLDGHEKIVKEASAVIDKYHDPIIKERIQQWRNPNDPNYGKKEIQDFLDVLITLKDSNSGPLLTPEEIKAESREIMLAAVDNPSNVVEWIMAELINHPDILQKAIEELDREVGRERLVQESDIPRLNYIKSCIREGFRLHPIVPFNVPHVALRDTTVAGYFIPKGSHVVLSRIGLGRNPEVWQDPLEFRPERHLNECYEVTLTEPNLRFISFSTGRRGCIAPLLGTCMTTMLLARLLQGFKWNLPGKGRCVDLSEAKTNLYLVEPLIAGAEPRLPPHLYPAPSRVTS